MFYYIYQITNLVNNKVYVGVHKTKNLEDGYMGSGKVIKAAIEKYGLENFKKDILEFFENAELMYAKEKELVTEEFLEREDTYNLRRGGTGGFDWINNNKLQGFSDVNVARRGRQIVDEQLRLTYGEEWRQVLANIASKSRSEETYEKATSTKRKNGTLPRGNERLNSRTSLIKKKNTFKDKKHQQGNKNSQFGTCWIWHELVGNKKCKREHLPLYIEQGWYKGRFKENGMGV